MEEAAVKVGGGNLEAKSKAMKKVMVAMEESECSHHALRWALTNLRESLPFNNTIVVFTAHSLPNFTYLSAASVGNFSAEVIRSVEEHQTKVSADILDKAKQICDEYGVVAETITVGGDPKEAICEAVEKLKIDLLILGNHGRGALQRAFLGSVSNYIVHNAKCPVLVVKN